MELKIPVKVEYTNVVVKICKNHPTCDGCAFWKKHKGCYFRGKTPREWDLPKEFESEQAIPLDRIKKAREEMIDSQFYGKTVATYNDAIMDCVKILDKLIESEEK